MTTAREAATGFESAVVAHDFHYQAGEEDWSTVPARAARRVQDVLGGRPYPSEFFRVSSPAFRDRVRSVAVR